MTYTQKTTTFYTDTELEQIDEDALVQSVPERRHRGFLILSC